MSEEDVKCNKVVVHNHYASLAKAIVVVGLAAVSVWA